MIRSGPAIAHDLNNTLMPLTLSIEVLELEGVPERFIEEFRRCIKNVQRFSQELDHMERYTPDELDLLANLADHEERARQRDRELKAQGASPEFMRDLGHGTTFKTHAGDLAKKLRAHAQELRHKGPYR